MCEGLKCVYGWEVCKGLFGQKRMLVNIVYIEVVVIEDKQLFLITVPGWCSQWQNNDFESDFNSVLKLLGSYYWEFVQKI